MTLIPDSSASITTWIAATVVGGTIIWTGVIKALAPHTFRRHLATLGWIPANRLAVAVTLAAAFESSWGTALLLRTYPRVVLPASIIMLALLSAISWWGVQSGKATDCGCYGGFIQPSIRQSLGLNAMFATLLFASWV
ncbi:MAG TPA: MauE/DoxX family redox-associated membrane protein, partial [Gemmatimonadaceae bacterium]|nr:MauE/DoxX family redox-associated membrane protein [Gemmatimonadaceae bacterium]